MKDVNARIEADIPNIIAARLDSMQDESNELMKNRYIGPDSALHAECLPLA
ncbi:MAG: hypothetical protein K1X68_10395 [Saprospiraceae bacterium]|nr:hypothetical protein [Saprospiraceae bacterium]HMW39754.1 hypothetical protein [Saprospiraceae bacterium]HMX89111.1 hypothetical protein [Saprospiraceae bacterium]HMZ41103.1 hypothetical protein [Saprospiraceae bacterium]HNA63443.1 hypothetical protein [Saprospiraceae bacterium]